MDGQDDFLYSRYNMPDPTPPNAQQATVGAWTQNPDQGLQAQTPDQTTAQTTQLADQSRATHVENVIADPAMPMDQKTNIVKDHAANLGTPDTSQATVGLAQQLSADGGEQPPDAVATRQAWDARKASVQAMIAQKLSDYGQSKFVGNNPVIDANGKTNYGNLALNGVENAAWGMLSIAKDFVSPDSHIQLVNIAQKYVPDANWQDYGTSSSLMNEFGRRLIGMQPDQAKSAVNEILSTIDQGDMLGGKNPYAQQALAQQLLGNAFDQTHGTGGNILSALALLGPLGSVGDAIKLGRTATGVAALSKLNNSIKGIDLSEVLRDIHPQPAIPVGTVADAATLTTQGAKQAVNAMGTPTGAAQLAARGVSPDQVAGSLILPKFSQNLDELGRPMVDPYFYNEGMRASVEARVSQGFNDVLSTRVKDITLGDLTDKGFKYTAQFGSANGQGFQTAQFAAARAKALLGDQQSYTITQAAPIGAEKTGRFFVQVAGEAMPGLSDVTSSGQALTRTGSLVTRLFGRASAYTPYFNKMLSAASRRSDLALQEATTNLKPYFNLGSGDKAGVNAVLEEGDRLSQTFTVSDLNVRGLNPKQMDAYYNIQKFAARDHSMADFNARETLLSQGARDFTNAGESSIIKPVSSLPSSAKVLDLGTMKAGSSDLKTGDRAFEFMDPRADGTTHGVIRAGSRATLNDLPQKVLSQIPGYLLRRNEFPYYVRNMTDGKMEVGVTSSNQGADQIAALKATNPGKDYAVLPASEIDPNAKAIMATDISRLKEQGLFYTSKRNPDALLGIDGLPRVMAPEDALKQMVNRYANNAGIRRFVTVMSKDLNERVQAIDPNARVALGTEPVIPTGRMSVEDAKAITEVKRIQGHLEMISGMSKTQTWKPIAEARAAVANVLYNANNFTSGGADNGIKSIADNISGMSDSFLHASKSSAFFAYLGTNVLRGPFLHTGMMPTYLALRGVGKYALSGQYFTDLGQLTKAALTDSRPSGDAGMIHDAWVASGLQGGIKAHLLTSQSIFDTGLRIPGMLDDTLGTALRGLKMAGFDAPLTLEKMGAFTASLRRWRVDNGMRWPKSEGEIDQITHDTEQLSLNSNRTDPLPTQNGILGAATQFAGYHIKAASRILQIEGGTLSPAERVSMAALTLGTYGLDGLRLGGMLDALEAKVGKPIPEDVKEVIKQGVYGTLYNTVIGAAANGTDAELRHWTDGEHRNMADFSGSIGPYNFVGSDINTLTRLFGVSVSQYPEFTADNGQGLLGAIKGQVGATPIGGLVGSAGDVMKFGALVAGIPDMDLGDKAKAVAAHALRQFPISGNLLKALAIYNQGVSVDKRGNPLAVAGSNEMISALSGFQTYNQEEQSAALRALHGESTSFDNTKLSDEVKTQAQQNGAVIVEALNNLGDGKKSAAEVQQLLRDHANLVNELWDQKTKRDYLNALVKYVSSKDVFQSQRIVQSYVAQIRAGKVTLSGNLNEQLDGMHFDGSEQIKAWIKQQQDIGSAVGNLMSEGGNGSK